MSVPGFEGRRRGVRYFVPRRHRMKWIVTGRGYNRLTKSSRELTELAEKLGVNKPTRVADMMAELKRREAAEVRLETEPKLVVPEGEAAPAPPRRRRRTAKKEA